jgi:Flp pilus assembly pilin Flp
MTMTGFLGVRSTRLMKVLLLRALEREDGQDLIEYSLLIGVITVASMIAISAIGGKITQYFTTLNTSMP